MKSTRLKPNYIVMDNTVFVIEPLTKREKEILWWLKEGKSSLDIAMMLSISQRTVKYHITNSLGKLNATNRTHAVAIAIENKLI